MTSSAPPPAAAPPPADTGCTSAARVLRLEAEALLRLADTLGEPFEKALDCLAAIQGRVVVTGMGKSGHIAKKIAATFASTGTPAQFVHPGEASHGDLGMIARNDGVVALSNSGETSELADVIAYTRRFGIPLVAITRNANSSLAEQADILLQLPTAPEACPLGLAPTTSTTMMLALGDALAVALYERRGFSATDFYVFHPGGQLGRQLLRVSDIMHKGAELPVAPAGTPMADVILAMTRGRFGCIGILDGAGLLAGIITDGDLRRHMNPGLLATAAETVMTRQPKTIRPGALVAEAIGQMNTLAITSLFVTVDEKPVGIVHIHDCLRTGVA